MRPRNLPAMATACAAALRTLGRAYYRRPRVARWAENLAAGEFRIWLQSAMYVFGRGVTEWLGIPRPPPPTNQPSREAGNNPGCDNPADCFAVMHREEMSRASGFSNWVCAFRRAHANLPGNLQGGRVR